MGLVYFNGRFVPEESIQKTANKDRVLQLLRSFLDDNEPGLVRFLVRIWNDQGNAITYKELREAILAGDIDPQWIDDWMQDYAKFVKKNMVPAWEKAISAGAASLAVASPSWYFNPMGEAIRTWTAAHSAEFITNVTSTQIDALRALVRRAATMEDISVDELARTIRPLTGLTKQQAEANLRYFNKLRENGVAPKRARDLSARYAARQHRYRAYQVARTELGFAYNKGADEGIRQAQAAGYMGEVEKVWCTADDERTCSICGALEGKRITMDEDFDFKTSLTTPGIRRTPPAHPSCRCAVLYEPVAPKNESN